MNFIVVAIIVCCTIALLRYLLKSRQIEENPKRPDKVYHDEECSICLEDKTYPVQASCGHEFCAACIIGSLEKYETCPMCRRSISILFRNFKECPDDIKRKLVKYNAFHDDRGLWQIVYEAPILIQRFFTNNDYRDTKTTFFILFLLAIAIGYLLLPHDLLDESVYGYYGIIDDLGIVSGILLYISILIFKAVVSRDHRVE